EFVMKIRVFCLFRLLRRSPRAFFNPKLVGRAARQNRIEGGINEIFCSTFLRSSFTRVLLRRSSDTGAGRGDDVASFGRIPHAEEERADERRNEKNGRGA